MRLSLYPSEYERCASFQFIRSGSIIDLPRDVRTPLVKKFRLLSVSPLMGIRLHIGVR